jgi:hypothetical protein
VTIGWVGAVLVEIKFGWEEILEAAVGRVGDMGTKESDAGDEWDTGACDDEGEVGEIGSVREWEGGVISGSCIASLLWRAASLLVGDTAGKGEEAGGVGAVEFRDDVVILELSKGKGMITSPVEGSREGGVVATCSLAGKEVSSNTTWRDKYTLLVTGSRHL